MLTCLTRRKAHGACQGRPKGHPADPAKISKRPCPCHRVCPRPYLQGSSDTWRQFGLATTRSLDAVQTGLGIKCQEYVDHTQFGSAAVRMRSLYHSSFIHVVARRNLGSLNIHVYIVRPQQQTLQGNRRECIRRGSGVVRLGGSKMQ